MNNTLVFQLVLVFLSTQSFSQKIAGRIELEGQVHPVYADFKEGKEVKFKYIVDQNGKKVDIRTVSKNSVNQIRKTYGKFGLRLFNLLQNSSEWTEFDVFIKFAPDQKLKKLLDSPPKPSLSHVRQIRTGLFYSGIEEIKTTLGISDLPVDLESSNPSRATLALRLTKDQLQKLKTAQWISSISLIETGSVYLTSDMSGAYGNSSGGGLGMSAFTSHGTNVNIGVIDPNVIDTLRLNNYLYDIPLTVRSGSRGGATGYHGANTVAIIRNSIGSTGTFTKGGAYSVNSINYAKIPRNQDGSVSIDSILSVYEWCIDRGVSVINSSWGIQRWISSFADSLANKVDYYLDSWTSDDWVLQVVSAGNSGSGASEYFSCINSGNPDWNSSNCQRVMKYGHNILAVGNMNDATNYNYSIASSSSWVDGLTYDEVPHVVANGQSVILPWSESVSGTSYSAAEITSFAASLISTRYNLSYYPEMTKAIIMLSAVANPSIDASRWSGYIDDQKAGMGLPDASYGARMASGATFSSFSNHDTLNMGSFGALDYQFNSSKTSGDSVVVFLRIDTTACTLHFLNTWISNPDHAAVGGVISADDLDTYIYENGVFMGGSYSSTNTAEYISFNHSGGVKVYRLVVFLYSRVSTSSHSIWGSCAWSPTF